MNKQISLSTLSDELSQVRTKKKEFLEQIERIVPWGEWLSLIKPCYYKGERGNKPYDLELMLRIYLIQNLIQPVIVSMQMKYHTCFQNYYSTQRCLIYKRNDNKP